MGPAGRRYRSTAAGTQQHGAQQHGAQQHGAQQHGAQQHGVQQHGAQQHGAQQHSAQQHSAQQRGVQQQMRSSSVTLSADVGSCRETCLVLCAGSSCCCRNTVPEKAAVVRRTLTRDSTRHCVTPDIRPTGPPTSWVYTLRRPVLQPCGERSRAENYNKRHNKFIFLNCAIGILCSRVIL